LKEERPELNFIKEIYKIWVSERPTQLAAALAYFGLFSFAPVIYIAFLVAGIFVDRSALLDRMITSVEATLGPGITQVIQGLLEGVTAKASGGTWLISLISFILLLLAASGVFFQLQFALNAVWKVPIPTEKVLLRTLRKQLFSFLIVIALGLLLIAAALFSFFANWLSSFLTLFGFRPSLTIIGFFVMAGLTFTVLYKILPEVKIAWRDVWGGAIVAASLVTIGGWVVAFLIQKTSFASALEATGSFVILLTGFYYFAQIFLLGAIISRVYAQRYGSMRPLPVDEPQGNKQLENSTG
jgi:membrane protein